MISTSALELGIDVGGLDVCILVGYPGSQIATWQRAGPRRPQRRGRDRARRDARRARPVPGGAPARASSSAASSRRCSTPRTPELLAAHLPCAAAELPLRAAEPWLGRAAHRRALAAAEERGALLRSESGREWFAARRAPHRAVSLRSTGTSFEILEPRARREPREDRDDRERARLHRVPRGRDLPAPRARLPRDALRPRASARSGSSPRTAPPTRARSPRRRRASSRASARGPAGNFRLCLGRVKVTTRVTGYERRRVRGQELLGTEPLELPPTSFETTSLWLELPDEIPKALAARRAPRDGRAPRRRARGALALPAVRALRPLRRRRHHLPRTTPSSGARRSSSTTGTRAALGLAAGLFERIEALLEATRERLARAATARRAARAASTRRAAGTATARSTRRARSTRSTCCSATAPWPCRAELASRARARPARGARAARAGRARAARRRLRPRDAARRRGRRRLAQRAPDAARARRHLGQRGAALRDASARPTSRRCSRSSRAADLVVGFNALRFDYRVLRGYTDRDLAALPTFDLLDAVHARLGFRLKLGHLGEETLGVPKSADGLQSLRWWSEGRVEEIERYCRDDVAILRDLFEHARAHGHLLFRTKRGERVRLPLRLSLPELIERARSGARSAAPPQPVPTLAPLAARPEEPGLQRSSQDSRPPCAQCSGAWVAQAAVEQLEVEQHQHVPDRGREPRHEAPRLVQGRRAGRPARWRDGLRRPARRARAGAVRRPARRPSWMVSASKSRWMPRSPISRSRSVSSMPRRIGRPRAAG